MKNWVLLFFIICFNALAYAMNLLWHVSCKSKIFCTLTYTTNITSDWGINLINWKRSTTDLTSPMLVWRLLIPFNCGSVSSLACASFSPIWGTIEYCFNKYNICILVLLMLFIGIHCSSWRQICLQVTGFFLSKEVLDFYTTYFYLVYYKFSLMWCSKTTGINMKEY